MVSFQPQLWIERAAGDASLAATERNVYFPDRLGMFQRHALMIVDCLAKTHFGSWWLLP